MKRAHYPQVMTNDQMLVLLAKLDNFSSFLRDAADGLDMFATTGREALKVRQSKKDGKKALDYGEFFNFLKARNPDAANHLSKAEVLKFEWGRLHIRFPNDGLKADLGWMRNQIEMLAEKFYHQPFKILVRQSALPY